MNYVVEKEYEEVYERGHDICFSTGILNHAWEARGKHKIDCAYSAIA